jgi:nudix-type nucleoside diphosphatase (YffH/AdpP family)
MRMRHDRRARHAGLFQSDDGAGMIQAGAVAERDMRKVEVISGARIFDDFFQIEEARLRFERYGGGMGPVVRRLKFERGDSAAALLVDPRRKCVYLTEQFKYPTLGKADGWIVEIVAGTMEAGEGAEATIRREILEEVGFEVDTLESIADFFVSPGSSSERIFLFYAAVSDSARKSRGGGLAAENEDIRVMEWPLEDFLSRVRSGTLRDAKTLVAGYWLAANYARIVGS